MPHSNCLCPSPSPSAGCWKGCLSQKSLTTSEERDPVSCREHPTMKCLHFIPFSSLDFSDERLHSCHSGKTSLFQISDDEKTFYVCACPLASVPALGWQVCGGYLWISLWDRENVVLDRHGKGIRQMCCCVWVDRAPGFYCCSSRGPLGPLNLAVKFWESQR